MAVSSALVLLGITCSACAGDDYERVFYDYLDEQGNLNGGMVYLLTSPDGINLPRDSWNWETLVDNGPTENRIDYVFVGDGYTAVELGSYNDNVMDALVHLFGEEPYIRYEPYFNVHRVDVISNESGVDNDPVQGIDRDTALDMAFWCGGIERLLCVNVAKAKNAAACAPDYDVVLAVANSEKYGGAGYIADDLATFAGGNDAAPDIAQHELGHSLGNLTDEYDYGDGSVYDGDEPEFPNVSIYTAAEMASMGTKWAAWLGEDNPDFNGLVDTYEGAFYKQYGIYRPTVTSKMRALGNPFNLPSVEAIIFEIYRYVDPIDDSTPTDATLDGSETVYITPLQPVGDPLDIQWYIDGEMIPGATGDEVDLRLIGLGLGTHELSVKVVDNTTLVRDETQRQNLMTQQLTWSVEVTHVFGDLNGDGCVNQQDLGILLASYNVDAGGDIDGDGDTDQADLGILLSVYELVC